MKRLLPLALLILLLVPARAAGDGCSPETCGVRSVTVPGSPVVALRPFGSVVTHDVRTGARRFAAPYGVLSADGRAFWVSRNLRDRTDLRRRDARTGRLTKRYELRSRLGVAAVSADGRFVALTDARSTRLSTGVVMVDGRTGQGRDFALAGNFRPEAVSRDGRRLFLVEYVRRGYRVRVFDVDRGRLRPGELRLANENQPMRGFPAYAIGGPDGHWLLTLYVKPQERGRSSMHSTCAGEWRTASTSPGTAAPATWPSTRSHWRPTGGPWLPRTRCWARSLRSIWARSSWHP